MSRVFISRRQAIAGLAGTSALALTADRVRAAGLTGQGQNRKSGELVAVVGAGVFGSWTAWQLLQQGYRVKLLDAWGPAHSRASSGGESRLTRTEYSGDELYTRMAWESLADWRWLSDRAGLPVFHPVGALYVFDEENADLKKSLALHERLKIPVEVLEVSELARRYPQMSTEGIRLGIFEPGRGALMARRAVQTLVQQFVRAGGSYEQRAIRPPEAKQRLDHIETNDGARITADRFVFACGSWLPKLFPDVIGTRILPVRMEYFFFAPEAGDTRFTAPNFPGWVDVHRGDYFYGFPDLEARGFKVAHDRYGNIIDPDTQDRRLTPALLEEARTFMRRRFPLLADRPLTEARVCQYENTDSKDFIIDRHPQMENVWIVGGGSGHGFKHGPAVGSYAAQLLSGKLARVEPRFALAIKKPQSSVY